MSEPNAADVPGQAPGRSQVGPGSLGGPTGVPAGRAANAAYGVWLQNLADKPYRFDFYQTLRHIESANPHLPRLGEAVRPSDEPVRIGQPADQTFASAPLQALQYSAEGVPRLMQRIFGLIGPNGPLPTHMTELTRDRSQHHADAGLQRFLDTFTHRFGLLFYRAWAQAQPVISLDRPGDNAFARRLGSLSGLGSETLMARDAIGDAAKLHFTGRLARHVRDADGLLAWCKSEFDAQVQVEQWCGHWMPLARDERTRLRKYDNPRDSQANYQGVGQGAVLGASAWDVQHKFRIVIGPLKLARYHAFLPGGSDLAKLQAMVRQWVGLEFEWDLKLILARPDVPSLSLGRSGELGRSAWLGHYKRPADADDLIINVERTLHARRAAAKAGSLASSLATV